MKNENQIRSRPYLENYDLALKIKSFFTDFVGDTSEYTYVSASERRCFNLAYIFLPEEQKVNLVSNSGLLQYHRELTRYFADHGCFPRILILDDLMVHGRGMSKFLNQLETLIEADLMDLANDGSGQKQLPMEARRIFRHRLVQAVDLLVFAQNERPLLLDDRYRFCLKSEYILSERELHDLSWQLSDSLTRWRQANTCFAYSERNEDLWSTLVHECTLRNIEVEGWEQILWEYDEESMGVFLRFDEPRKTTRISSIRFFPGRNKQRWFTSFTMLGAMPGKVIRELGEQFAELLRGENKACYAHILKLLTEDRADANCAIGQLLSYFLSVSDYRAFLRAIPNQHYQTPNEEWILRNTDIDKVSRNFGKEKDVHDGLVDILCSEKLMESIYQMLLQKITRSAAPICAWSLDEATGLDGDIPYKVYNQRVEELFYKVGIDAEESAARWFYNVEVFQPASYQEYSGRNAREKTGGVISLSDFFIYAASEHMQRATNPYYHVAALIHVMDYGLMGIRVGEVDGAGCQIFLCKAGEMATFYGPRRIATAIPALAILEESCRGGRFTPRELIDEFTNSLDEEKIRELIHVDEATWESQCRKKIKKLKDEIPKVTKELYRGDQHYTEWNFKNLTTMSTLEMRRFQRALQYLATLRV